MHTHHINIDTDTIDIQDNRGVTLVELLVVIFIMSLIGTAGFMLQNDVFKFNRIIFGQLDAQGDARQTLRKFTSDLRTAVPSSTGTYPIAQAATSSITFYANIDNDAYVERVRYFLATTTLKRGVIKPSGSPLTYNSASETVTDLVQGIANGTTSIFTYYDENYDGSTTTPPLSLPVATQLIRLVKIEMVVDQNPNQPPAPETFTTQVTLRNI
jgi:prepilin-type N-terminal cleavage/methylation domain-containing protein